MPYVQQSAGIASEVPEISDGLLVQQAVAGDQGAFESLVARYYSLLFGYIRGVLNDHEEAGDVLQHVLLRFYVSLPTLLTYGSLRWWLFQVARHCCVDELRKRRRRPAVYFSALEREGSEEDLSPIELIPDPQPLPEEVAEQVDLQCVLHQAISALPPKLRSIVLLHSFRQLSFSEIGRMLKMPESTVKTYFYRALSRLRTALALYDPTGEALRLAGSSPLL